MKRERKRTHTTHWTIIWLSDVCKFYGFCKQFIDLVHFQFQLDEWMSLLFWNEFLLVLQTECWYTVTANGIPKQQCISTYLLSVCQKSGFIFFVQCDHSFDVFFFNQLSKEKYKHGIVIFVNFCFTVSILLFNNPNSYQTSLHPYLSSTTMGSTLLRSSHKFAWKC